MALRTVAALAPGPARADDPHPAATGRNVANALLLDATRVGERIVAVGERGIVLYSDDDGASWKQAAVPVDATLTAVTFADAQHGWVTGHDAVILATVDGGLTGPSSTAIRTWTCRCWHCISRTPTTDFAVGGRGNIFRTKDGGKTWTNEVMLTRDEFDGHLFGIGKADSGSSFPGVRAGRAVAFG